MFILYSYTTMHLPSIHLRYLTSSLLYCKCASAPPPLPNATVEMHMTARMLELVGVLLLPQHAKKPLSHVAPTVQNRCPCLTQPRVCGRNSKNTSSYMPVMFVYKAHEFPLLSRQKPSSCDPEATSSSERTRCKKVSFLVPLLEEKQTSLDGPKSFVMGVSFLTGDLGRLQAVFVLFLYGGLGYHIPSRGFCTVERGFALLIGSLAHAMSALVNRLASISHLTCAGCYTV
ncbi:hypothetical protein V8C35DRAFT_288838, partial [Trichoderma chlorosporum]